MSSPIVERWLCPTYRRMIWELGPLGLPGYPESNEYGTPNEQRSRVLRGGYIGDYRGEYDRVC